MINSLVDAGMIQVPCTAGNTQQWEGLYYPVSLSTQTRLMIACMHGLAADAFCQHQWYGWHVHLDLLLHVTATRQKMCTCMTPVHHIAMCAQLGAVRQ